MQNQKIKTISIIGAGAVGTFYGAKLGGAGFHVQFYSPSAKSHEKRNLNIKSVWGNFQQTGEFFNKTESMDPSDLIILSVKALESIRSVELIHPLVKENSIILVLQNGICEEETIQKAFPENPVMGGLAFTCINRIDKHTIDHQDYGAIKIGSLEEKNYAQAKELVEQFKEAGIQTIYGEPLRKLRWQKLLWNVPYNSLSVAGGLITTDIIINDEHLNALSRRMMKEVQQIAASENTSLPDEDIETMVENTRKMNPYKTSMMIDFELKRPMEVEAILGRPLRIAQKNKVTVPTIEAIYSLLSFMDKNHRSQ